MTTSRGVLWPAAALAAIDKPGGGEYNYTGAARLTAQRGMAARAGQAKIYRKESAPVPGCGHAVYSTI